MTPACERLLTHVGRIADNFTPMQVGRSSVRVSDDLYEEAVIAGLERQLNGAGADFKTITHLRGIELILDPSVPAGHYKMSGP